ncbi:heavy metal translocating P-type ATPase [Sporosarcina aquimarina]|uniref:Cd(2+)-exporting ATPase n=1 Tax=Sporosarcina aquimarina TaxID=114975 RepID=A0ABU4FX62_9BACL|nr:cation-translocating P-type ATPase [Sporosarcina aquimarina]MDW0108715.1 cation-translocating P-type ATPase [Sporosarcina aquimarina]
MNAKRTTWLTGIAAVLLASAFLLQWMGYVDARNVLLLLATGAAGIPIAVKAIRSLRMKTFSIELLVTIAVIGALIIGEYVESAAVTFLFMFGAYLEVRTLEKTRSSLKKLVDLAPSEATLLKDGELQVVSADSIEEGDRVIIRSGEKIAIDGRIAAGRGLVNEAAITGESVPVSKSIEDQVFSGTIAENGYLEVIAERVGEDTTFARIIELVEEAQESKSITQKFLDRFASIYTPMIVVLSVIVYLFTRNIEMTLTFLVIACPGALVISAPVSIVAGIGNGAKKGVLVKGGDIMERFAKVDVVVFDKTGTLTQGKPDVIDMHVWGMDERDFLKQIAEAEQVSEHHLGQTIVKEARKRGIVLANAPEDVEIVEGAGIQVNSGKRQVVIGNRKLMQKNDVRIEKAAQEYAAEREHLGNTVVFAAIGGELAGLVSIADQVRPEAKDAIQQLRKNGVKRVIMLTGDNRMTAEGIGNVLGLDQVHAELLPADKVSWIQKLKKEGHRVAMAGDGINDAPAIAAADIGVAMGEGGTDISMETADVVLMADKLDQFAHAYSLSKATVRNMKQNTVFAVGTVALLLAGVLLGKVFLAAGMLIHEASVLLVILNAMRLLRYTSRKPEDRKKRDRKRLLVE